MKTRIRKGHGAYMLRQFFKYIFQSIAGMIGISVYILADTFFISVHSGADGLAVLNLILPVRSQPLITSWKHRNSWKPIITVTGMHFSRMRD